MIFFTNSTWIFIFTTYATLSGSSLLGLVSSYWKSNGNSNMFHHRVAEEFKPLFPKYQLLFICIPLVTWLDGGFDFRENTAMRCFELVWKQNYLQNCNNFKGILWKQEGSVGLLEPIFHVYFLIVCEHCWLSFNLFPDFLQFFLTIYIASLLQTICDNQNDLFVL